MKPELRLLHADSLAGPMRALKAAFAAHHPQVSLALVSGVSRDLAQRIVEGEACDVFAPSSPAVIEQVLMAPGADAHVDWYIVFSANEMVVITARGNPLRIGAASDLAQPRLRFARVTGEKDLATARSVEFLKRATALEGKPELAQRIVDAAPADAARPRSVPEVAAAVASGEADAGVVYYSAAVAAGDQVEILRFPESVNMSEAIRNAATVPRRADHPGAALEFVRFLISTEAQALLRASGQPPMIPPLRKGALPPVLG